MLIIFFGGFIGCEVAYYNSNDKVTIDVIDKDVKRNGNSDKYLIYTDNTTYEVTDLFWHFDFYSSDEYGHIKVGKTYECDCYGWRIGWLSWYKNIKNCKEINKSE